MPSGLNRLANHQAGSPDVVRYRVANASARNVGEARSRYERPATLPKERSTETSAHPLRRAEAARTASNGPSPLVL